MSTRTKLAILALGALVVALSLLVPVVVPEPAPPGSVDQVELQLPPGGEQRAAAGPDKVTPDRRSRRDDRRSRATGRRAAESKASPDARSSRAKGVRRADATLPGPHPAADSPTRQPRSDSAPRADGSPTPRTTPVGVNPPAPDHSAPQRDPTSVPSEPADPPDADVTTAGADPPDEPEPVDPPDSDATTAGADPPDEPESAGGEPLNGTP